ncbi:sodium/glutamate symporter [Bacillaceae bacterium SAS-127]|nr:sodium/glutamate symporter [Bacillaceae bacterium SAS-127]
MNIQFDQVTTIFLAVALLVIGSFLVKKVGIFQRFCLPAPVVGGLLFALIATILKATGIVEFTLDTSLQSLFMLAFFTTVGLGASFQLVKLGGKLLVIYWLACGFLALMQNLIGISVASLLNIDPLLGIMSGAVSMEGGHGSATAFGTTLEEMGVDSALTIGLAAATLGLVAGGLIGGPTVKYLISKYNLTPAEQEVAAAVASEGKAKADIHSDTFIMQVLLITFCMALGTYLGEVFSEKTKLVLPSYVGAMFVAVIVRNVLDRVNDRVIDMRSVNLIGDVTLGIFLSMALMSVKLWEVAELALPIFIIVAVQVVFIVIMGVFVLFRLLGKDYDAAVMVGGFTGHGLGATPNAMANMSAITQKFGPSQKAYLIVPIVGAFLIDVFAVPIILTSINLFQ